MPLLFPFIFPCDVHNIRHILLYLYIITPEMSGTNPCSRTITKAFPASFQPLISCSTIARKTMVLNGTTLGAPMGIITAYHCALRHIEFGTDCRSASLTRTRKHATDFRESFTVDKTGELSLGGVKFV